MTMRLSEEVDVPYQSLINLNLRDCRPNSGEVQINPLQAAQVVVLQAQ